MLRGSVFNPVQVPTRGLKLALLAVVAILRAMKFFAAIAVYLLLGVALGWGLLLAVKGSLWFLVAGLVVYVLLLAKLGCQPKPH